MKKPQKNLSFFCDVYFFQLFEFDFSGFFLALHDKHVDKASSVWSSRRGRRGRPWSCGDVLSLGRVTKFSVLMNCERKTGVVVDLNLGVVLDLKKKGWPGWFVRCNLRGTSRLLLGKFRGSANEINRFRYNEINRFRSTKSTDFVAGQSKIIRNPQISLNEICGFRIADLL